MRRIVSMLANIYKSGTLVKLALLFLIAFLFSGYSTAASFDCHAAGTAIEKLICSDALMSRQDAQLASNYTNMLGSLDEVNKKKLMVEQRSWLKNSRNLCDDLACLRRSYATRIQMIRECNGVCIDRLELYRVDGENHNLLTLRNSNERNASFNDSLRAHHIEPVIGCETLVEVALGTAHGEISFGGLCKLKGRSDFVMVCNDALMGHFQLTNASSATSRDALANFTIRNCYGG